jgi:CRISPR-associated exonuclease Cas4
MKELAMLNVQDVGGLHVKYLHHCPRQLWLYARGFRPEANDDLVSFGTVIDATTFQRKRPIDLGAARPDWVDGDGWIHERKSSRHEQPGHREQVRLYCLLLKEAGTDVRGGILHYPLTRRTVRVPFDKSTEKAAVADRVRVVEIVGRETSPERIERGRCKGCAYVPYCWGTNT